MAHIRRRPAAVMIAALLACLLLVIAVRAGMGVPGLERLFGLSPSSMLDYSRFPARVSRLSPDFISRELGIRPSVATPAAGRAQSPRARPATHAGARRTVVDHRATNDDFDQAYAVGTIPFTARTDASQASRRGDPDVCAPVGGTVWYRYTPEQDGGLIVNTIGTKYATALGAFTGGRIDSLTQVPGACHRGVRGGAYVTFPAQRGVTYHFQVTVVAGGGPLVFNLDPFGETTMVSPHANATAAWHGLSADGRHVVFSSPAADLVPGDTNGVEDEFVRDLATGKVERVSVSTSGEQGNAESKTWPPAISADGRYVAFTSFASNLVEGDTNGYEDAFVRDRLTGVTERVSVSSTGAQGDKPVRGNGDPWAMLVHTGFQASDEVDWGGAVAISGDGRFVAFHTDLTGLTPEDEPGADDELLFSGIDVFVHDRLTRRTVLASISADGTTGNAMSGFPSISDDGRFVTYTTSASNIVHSPLTPLEIEEPPGLRSYASKHVVVRDLKLGRNELISISVHGKPSEGSGFGVMTPDGRYVAFTSIAADLVPKDENEMIDIFVRDRWRGTTELVSLTSTGEQQFVSESVERTRSRTPRPSISADGRYVAFHSDAKNLVGGEPDESILGVRNAPGCNWQREEAFVRDRFTGVTTHVSVTPAGRTPNGASVQPMLSADGRRVLFVSVASDIDSRDEDGRVPATCLNTMDLFIHTFPILR